MLEEYRQSLAKLIDNCQGDRRADAGNDGVGRRHQQGLGRDEVGPAGRSETARSRVGRDHRRDRTADPDARRRRLPARLRLGVLPRQGYFPADDEDVQRDARTRRRQFRSRAAGPWPQGRTRRDGECGRRVQGAGNRPRRARRRHPGSAEQGRERRAPRRTDSFCGRFRSRGRRHRRQRLIVSRAARSCGGHADTDRGNHPEPVEPGRRRLGRSLHQHAVGGVSDRGIVGVRRRDRAARQGK